MLHPPANPCPAVNKGQAHEIIPKAIKGTGDSLVDRDILTTVGFPSPEGWYFTDAAPNLMAADKAQDFIKRFQARFGLPPYNYAICAYDAALVIIDAMQRLTAAGTPITREAMRDAIQSAKVETLQGVCRSTRMEISPIIRSVCTK